MYTPAHYAMSEEAILALLEGPISGDLVTQSPSGISATYTPFVYDSSVGKYGSLIGHLAWLNDDWKNTGKEVMVIFHGPEAYLSSDWLREPGEEQVVAITNFVTVQVRGELIVHTDAQWAADAVDRLSRSFEPAYDILEVPERLLVGMMKAMVAIEIRITSIEGHARMSQQRTPDRIQKIIAGLRSVGNDGAANWMETYSLPKAIEKELIVQAAAARKRPRAPLNSDNSGAIDHE